MTSNDATETERAIRQKLEASGQYGKMRAMIMEAALQTVELAAGGSSSSSSSSPSKKQVFRPSAALLEAKERGVTELSVVLEYLHALGLNYTESVLRLEAGLKEIPLQSSEALHAALEVTSPGPCLTALLHGDHPQRRTAETVEEVPPPAPQTAYTVEEVTPDDASEELDAETEEVGSDHDQPGAEDSTYFISSWKKRHFVRWQQVTGQQVQLDRLADCETVILDELDSLTADDCEGGELVIAACEGSVFLRNCKNMTVHVSCKQLRTRDCENIDLHIFTTTDPVVEMSHHIHFYPFHLRIPELRHLFTEARLDPVANRFVHVYDFTPSEPSLPQPHFEVHFPQHGQAMESRFASYGTPECPPEIEQLLALQLMPAASSESGKNKSYDIKTGAQAWATAGTAALPAVAAGAGAATAAATATSTRPPLSSLAPRANAADASSSDHSSVHSSSVSDVKSDSTSESGTDDGANSDGSSQDVVKAVKQQPAPTLEPIPVTVGEAVPTPVAAATKPTPTTQAATPGGLDNEEYSSFDDEDDDDHADDKYEVEEDEDDF